MTLAVCLKCGHLKFGAFTRCSQCGTTPDDDESLTKHLLLSDHFHTRAELEAIAAEIRAGRPPEFDPETLRQAWVSKQELDADVRRMSRGCGLTLATLFFLAAAIAIVARLWFRNP